MGLLNFDSSHIEQPMPPADRLLSSMAARRARSVSKIYGRKPPHR